MKTYTVKTTSHYIELDDGTEVELPYEACEYITPIMSEDGKSFAFAIQDEYPEVYNGFGSDTGVYFIQFSPSKFFFDEDADQFKEDFAETHSIFPVSYYEHGLCQWSVGVAEKNWDTVSFAGMIAIPNDFTNPGEVASAYLQEYTNWCNGSVYGICIISRDSDGDWTEEHACWGFYGVEQAEQGMRDNL